MGIADFLAEHWESFLGMLFKARAYFSTKKNAGEFRKVLILGCGGVGKTTVGKVLSSSYQEQIAGLAKYEESLGDEMFDTTIDSCFVVLPGQKLRRETIWPKHLEQLANGEFDGVILVECNGYHSIDIDVKFHSLWAGDLDRFKSDFLDSMRKDEEEVIRLIMPYLERRREPLWFLHIINKMDLWFSEEAAVRSRYESSEVALKLKTCISNKNRYEQVFASFGNINNKSANGIMLFKHDAGFDQTHVLQSQEKLLKTLLALQEWGIRNER